MSESKKTPAPETNADAKETKTKKAETVEVPAAADEKKEANEADQTPEVTPATETKVPTAKSEEVLVSEGDLSKDPVLKEIGIEVGDSYADVAKKAISYIKSKAVTKSGASAPEPKVTKDEVLAVKDGEERTFPRAAWNNMGSDRNGWKVKAKTPSEARKESK